MARVGRGFPARPVVARPPADIVAPTVPGNLHTASVTQVVVSIAWDPATDDYALAGYGIWLDGVKRGADQAGTTATLTGLTAGTTYLVEVDAVDASGNRSARASVSVVTLPEDSVPPSVPGGLVVFGVGPRRATLTWSPSTDNVGVVGYGMWLDGVHVGDAPGLSYVFALAPGISYVLGVDAFDAAGNRSAKATAAVTTPADLPPSPPVNLTLTGATRTSATIGWDPGTDDDGVAGYRIRLDGTVVETLWATGTSYTFAGLAENSAHTADVATVDTAGQTSAWVSLPFESLPDQPPSPPPNLRQTGATYTSLDVAWDAATDDVGVTGYDVLLDGVPKAVNQLGRTFSFPGLREGTAYQVVVRAVDTAGQRSADALLTVETLDDLPPTPASIEVIAVTEETITVRWGTSTDDFGVVAYRILLDGVVAHSPPLDGVEWTIDGPTLRTHTIGDLIPGQVYMVGVQVEDTVGQTTVTEIPVQTTPQPFTRLEWPVYRVGSWAGNVRDVQGVEWIVEKAQGWAGSPPVKAAIAEAEMLDGGTSGAGLYGPRRIVLSGTAIAPTRLAMLAAKQRLVSMLHPQAAGALLVEGLDRTLSARVRMAEQTTVDDSEMASLGFRWAVTLLAGDPRRYAALPTRVVGVVEELPGQVQLVVPMDGTYPQVPARLRLYGPIRNWTIAHQQTGHTLRAKTGTGLPADPGSSIAIDLGARTVTKYVGGVAGPGRAALAHLPAWFQLVPGVNTLTLSGEQMPGESGTPRLIVEAYDAH
ncbi:fibronectin type III domain-containing protein (plasmid) [Microtetraspora malaysiensis]|uniref:fibronectin type III domain-containing protein n=1 Tax=Microtetraspora malaysiensis TaxID=161358 RepID=UPI003D8E581D